MMDVCAPSVTLGFFVLPLFFAFPFRLILIRFNYMYIHHPVRVLSRMLHVHSLWPVLFCLALRV